MSTPPRSPIGVRTLVTRGAGALVVALAVNLALGWIALSRELVASAEFFRYPGIVVWTVVGITGATFVYGVLTRRSPTPEETFVRVAVVALLLSFLPNIGLAFAVESVTTSEVLWLMALHVPPAVVAVLALPDGPHTR